MTARSTGRTRRARRLFRFGKRAFTWATWTHTSVKPSNSNWFRTGIAYRHLNYLTCFSKETFHVSVLRSVNILRVASIFQKYLQLFGAIEAHRHIRARSGKKRDKMCTHAPITFKRLSIKIRSRLSIFELLIYRAFRTSSRISRERRVRNNRAHHDGVALQRNNGTAVSLIANNTLIGPSLPRDRASLCLHLRLR